MVSDETLQKICSDTLCWKSILGVQLSKEEPKCSGTPIHRIPTARFLGEKV